MSECYTEASGLVPGSGESLNTYTVSVWCSGIHDTKSGYSGPRIPLKRCVCAAIPWITAEKEGGKGSSRASFANEEGEIQVIWGKPGQIHESRSSTILVYSRGIDICWANQVLNVFLPGLVMWIPLFISGHRRFLVYTRSLVIPLLIPGEVSYSHQWPWCGERFLGLNTPEERFLGRLQDWHLGELDPRCWEGPELRVFPAGPVSAMSNTVEGCSARLKAAASGGAALITSRVSGRAARGSGKIRPGLYPPASSLLFWDQSNVKAQQATQRRICGWVAGEQVRRGQIRKRCLYDSWLEYPA